MNSQIRPACDDDVAVLVDELGGYTALTQVAAQPNRL